MYDQEPTETHHTVTQRIAVTGWFGAVADFTTAWQQWNPGQSISRGVLIFDKELWERTLPSEGHWYLSSQGAHDAPLQPFWEGTISWTFPWRDPFHKEIYSKKDVLMSQEGWATLEEREVTPDSQGGLGTMEQVGDIFAHAMSMDFQWQWCTVPGAQGWCSAKAPAKVGPLSKVCYLFNNTSSCVPGQSMGFSH